MHTSPISSWQHYLFLQQLKKTHKKHQTSTTKGMQKPFLYRLHFPKALSSQRCGQEELQGTSCWENTRRNSHWESAMLSCFQKKRKDLQDMHLTQVWMGKPIGSRSSGISSFTLGLQTGTQVCRNKTEKRRHEAVGYLKIKPRWFWQRGGKTKLNHGI